MWASGGGGLPGLCRPGRRHRPVGRGRIRRAACCSPRWPSSTPALSWRACPSLPTARPGSMAGRFRLPISSAAAAVRSSLGAAFACLLVAWAMVFEHPGWVPVTLLGIGGLLRRVPCVSKGRTSATPRRVHAITPLARPHPHQVVRPGDALAGPDGGVVVLISLDTSDGDPPYEQIRTQIAAQVADGQLPPGTKLPTVRALADDARDRAQHRGARLPRARALRRGDDPRAQRHGGQRRRQSTGPPRRPPPAMPT